MAGKLLHSLAAGETAIDLPVLVVVAHPDDEVIGLGGQMPRLRHLSLLHVTDGAPRDGRDANTHGFATTRDYAAARRAELHAALDLAGVAPVRVESLDVPDQAASLELPRIIRALVERFRETRPAVVVTHPYEGGHPDHDATALAVQAACNWLRAQGEPVPERVEITSYHIGSQNVAVGRLRHAAALTLHVACGWLHARGMPVPERIEMAPYHAGPQGIEVGRFLHAEGAAPVTLALSPEVQALKQRMQDCFVSQRDTLALFPVGAVEMLRPAPDYDFTAPPHPGTLFYEVHPWGMTGDRFRALAAEAMASLELARAA